MSKAGAFIFGMITIICMFIICVGLLLIKKIDASLLPIGAVLTALVSLTGAYIGLQVANNGVKGKYFNEGLVEDNQEGK